MANINTKIFKSLNESEYKELYTPKRALTEATTDVNEIAEEYKKAYHIDLDWNRVPCVIARDKFLSGWGGAEGKTHYQVVLCGDSTEAANIESNMKSLGREEGLANIRRDFGVHLSPRVSKAYVVGRYASAWNNLSDSWYENRFDSGKTEDEINQEKDAQEERRQEKLRQKEQQANESEEVPDGEFKVGDVVKVPYKYGSYTPGEFTDAPIIDIEDGKYVTVEVPSKQVVMMDQLKKWNTLGECDKPLKEDSYDKGIFYEIEQAFEEAGLNPVRFIDDGILTRNIGWTVSSNGQSQQISCDGSWYDEDDLEESENLKEEYSEKLGGDPEDFIKDVEIIKAKLEEIDTNSFGAKLSQQMVWDWIETCDSQISMAKSRFLGELEEKKKLKEDIDTVHKMKDCTDDVEVIMALEGDTLELDDLDDWNRLKEIARGLASSQGFYGRLLANMEEVYDEDITFPVYL